MMPEKPLLPNALGIQGEIEDDKAKMTHHEDAVHYGLFGLYPPGGIRFTIVPEVHNVITEALDRAHHATLYAAGIREEYQGRPRKAGEPGPNRRQAEARAQRGGKSAAMQAMADELLKNNPGAKLARVSMTKDGHQVVHTTEAGGQLIKDADGVYRPKATK